MSFSGSPRHEIRRVIVGDVEAGEQTAQPEAYRPVARLHGAHVICKLHVDFELHPGTGGLELLQETAVHVAGNFPGMSMNINDQGWFPLNRIRRE